MGWRVSQVRAWIGGHWQVLILTLIVFVFWQSAAAFPMRMMVVFLHEMSHAIAAALTGGDVLSMTLLRGEGGSAVTRGGNLFLIASAGYLGSLLGGIGLLMIALKSRWDRIALAVLGAVTLVLTMIYMREVFALVFGIGTGISLMIASRYLPVQLCDMILRLLGLTSMIYVPYDIFSDTIARASMRSDARIIAETVGGPTVFWGGLWLVLSLVLIGATLRYGLGRSSNLTFRR